MNAKQTIIVSKKRAATRAMARRIAAAYADRLYTSRETSTSFRFRQLPPSKFKTGSFRTRRVAPGVAVVIGVLRGNGP